MSIIKELHKAIISKITTSVKNIKTYGYYPKLRTAIQTPAIFIDLTSFDPGTDPATGQLAVVAKFELRIIVIENDNSQIAVRELAVEVARIIHHNNFGIKTTPAKIISITQDGFSPELDAYDVWLIEWEHELHIGESVWDGDSIKNNSIYIGITPETGKNYINKYAKQ